MNCIFRLFSLMNDKFESTDPDTNYCNTNTNTHTNTNIDEPLQSSYYTLDELNPLCLDCQMVLFILNYNVRLWHANEVSFMALLDTLLRPPDVIVLTKTWLTCDTVDLYNIQGHMCYHPVRDDRRRGGMAAFSQLQRVSPTAYSEKSYPGQGNSP